MVYATHLQFAERSGLGIKVQDELLGTGDSAQRSYDLANDNIVAGSYTVFYAPASGNTTNSVTALTDVTDYTLDKDSGRILLTSAAATTVGTNKLYATYWFIDELTDDHVTDILAAADDEVDNMTGRTWDGPTSTTEYYNGKRDLYKAYPTTDAPFASDYDPSDYLMLRNYPVTKVSAVYFLSPSDSILSCFNYDDSGTTYTDITTEINDVTESLVTLFAAVPAANDIVYIGMDQRFLGLTVELSTVGTGSPAITWQYYNGTTWASLSVTEVDTSSSTFKASGTFRWTMPYGWAETTINSDYRYWIRGLLTAGYTIAPVAAAFKVEDIIQEVISPSQRSFEDIGKLIFTGTRIPDGQKNIRVEYSYGQATTPGYITNLSIYVASLMAYADISGGSYRDITSFKLGSKEFTLGEQYTNIREVIVEFRERIDDILRQVGKRVKIGAV